MSATSYPSEATISRRRIALRARRFLLLWSIAFFPLPSFAANSANCQRLLSQYLSEAPSSYRAHPDQVNVTQLKKGDSVVVMPKAFTDLPMVMSKVNGPIKMTVVDVKMFPRNQKKGWQGNRRLIYLDSRETGRVGLALWRLSAGNAYSTPEFAEHSPFVPGEYVQIGSGYESQIVLKNYHDPSTTTTFGGKAVPYLGTFNKVLDSGNYVVTIHSIGNLIWGRKVIVPKDNLYGLTSGTKETVRNTLKKLMDTRFSFVLGESVRFRDVDGLMQDGTFVRSLQTIVEIRKADGELVTVGNGSVFKKVGDLPARTSLYSAEWINAKFWSPVGVLADFLNGGAILTSHPDFENMTPREKIRTLLKYTQRNVPWTKAAISAENAGLNTFEKLVCAGVSVCRHNATLLSAMFSEAGFSTRLVKYTPPGENMDGHAWLEVDMKQADGTIETFVVDASNGEYIEPLWKIRQTVAKKPTSFEAVWYMQPGREYLLPGSP